MARTLKKVWCHKSHRDQKFANVHTVGSFFLKEAQDEGTQAVHGSPGRSPCASRSCRDGLTHLHHDKPTQKKKKNIQNIPSASALAVQSRGQGVTVDDDGQTVWFVCVQIIIFLIQNKKYTSETVYPTLVLVDDLVHRGLLVPWPRHYVLIVCRDVTAQHGRRLLRLWAHDAHKLMGHLIRTQCYRRHEGFL